jgi:hypothetical protein
MTHVVWIHTHQSEDEEHCFSGDAKTEIFRTGSWKAGSWQKQKRDRKRARESSPLSDPYFLSEANAFCFQPM